MHCASCTLLIDEVLEDLDGVHRSTTQLRKRRVVDFDPAACSPDVIVAAIAEAGYSGSSDILRNTPGVTYYGRRAPVSRRE